MSEISDSQQDILLRLKTRGPQTARALAQQLSITTVGVRQHLAALQQSDLVTQEGVSEQKRGRGRPVRPWRLTDRGHARFPDTHADVTVGLIASVRELFGEEGLDALIETRTRHTLAHYQRALQEAGSSLAAQLHALSRLRSAEGYMSEVKRLGDDSWLLIENHCPICAAATACQGFCRSELEVFRTLLGEQAEIERINHILHGARRCAYRVTAIA